ncbi:uncharacterized protein MKZ38_009684 [Zalerion maritima]|uniref:DNA/RNA-binding protein Alba-like domain-containing protein n=1 Tax=Zalerion maritima TaxID=339359 RepID=A0AAD5RTZ5_9PEZI|nr:uncharacterized protein MKZ38_009684 [Zalerion maritima]
MGTHSRATPKHAISLGACFGNASNKKRPPGKRGLGDSPHDDDHPKKRMNVGPTPAQQATKIVLQTHSAVLGRMNRKYHTEELHVISSSSIKGKVDGVLRHLSQFHPTDMSVLPGVVLLHSKSKCSQKLFTIIEIAKRRIHELDQKWYQYNKLHQVQVKLQPEELSGIEETVLDDGQGGDEQDDSEDDAFEPVPVSTEPQAINIDARPHLFLSVFLSRVPVPEFQDTYEYTMQTNTAYLEKERESRMGSLTAR